jgi:glycosyltransferase involved in cell wall biosynthesis
MQNSMVIPNGIDANKFKRDEHQRELFRKQYNLNKSDIAIGMVARIDPIKGYKVFVEVAKKISEEYANVYFFSVGGGSEIIKKECTSILGELNGKQFCWLGNQKIVEHIYSGFDISVSASLGEGFSNTIAEAMSCSLPCVVTDVGDSALIVDKFGVVVEAKSVDSLYKGVLEMINKEY